MVLHWLHLSVLVLGLALPSFASFENTAIVRSIDLGGSLVHTTTTYAVRALEDGSDVYVFALSEDEQKKTSWIEAKAKGQTKPLNLENHGLSKDSTYYYSVVLPKTLGVNQTANLVLETVQTHATTPLPAQAAQNDLQSLVYDTGLFVLSPYNTLVQRTKVRTASSSVISFTNPDGIDAFAGDSVATKSASGTTVTYGPYNNLPKSSTLDFINDHQQIVSIHYYYDYPVLAISKLVREAEVSHWGANLNIQDTIHLHNAGPTLKGHFSRLLHQTQVFNQRVAAHILTQFAFHLPAGIHDAYYYDLVGNVSTSNLRVAKTPQKGAIATQQSFLELKPRYPIMGGWNYSFTLGYDSDLADSARYDAKGDRYIVAVPVMSLLVGAVVEDADIKIVLPEAATDVEVFPPFPSVTDSVTTHTTYLDTVGRPTVFLHYDNLTDKHMGTIYVSYKVPVSAHLKKPVAVTTAFLGLFALAFAWKRVDLRLQK